MNSERRERDPEFADFGSIDCDDARAAIIERGYGIVADVVPAGVLGAIRDFWLDAFGRCREAAPIIWGPCLGEENRVLFHRSATNCLYRSYDFLWNPPIHAPTRRLGLFLNRQRNRIAEVDPRSGETFESDRYGIYVTASYYPPRAGWMAEHEDRAEGRRHWHFILPLTFKGADYAGGGLVLTDRSGGRVDVDAAMAPGSVIFYDGALRHGVEAIRPGPGQTLGRLQLFSIPVFLERPQDSDTLLETVSVRRFVKAKLRPLKHRLQGIRGPAPAEDVP